jgi:hypothetical protein
MGTGSIGITGHTGFGTGCIRSEVDRAYEFSEKALLWRSGRNAGILRCAQNDNFYLLRIVVTINWITGLVGFGTALKRSYSHRNDVLGSIREARRAGI